MEANNVCLIRRAQTKTMIFLRLRRVPTNGLNACALKPQKSLCNRTGYSETVTELFVVISYISL